MASQSTFDEWFSEFAEGLSQQIESHNNVRRRRVSEQSTPFTQWHRERLPGWYTWTDIDYCGYQDDEVYILIDYVKVPPEKLHDAPDAYPLWDHQRKIYSTIAEAVGCPAFIMWYTKNLDEFVVSQIDSDEVCRLDGRHGFCDFLDEYRIGVADHSDA